jgi:hypothetical protein
VCRRAIVGSRNVRGSIGKSLAAARPSSPRCASCPRGDLLSVGPVYSFDSVVRVDSARLLQTIISMWLKIKRLIVCLPGREGSISFFSRLNAWASPSP